MVLLWLVLGLLALDLAALLFAVDTRPGLEHSARPWSHPRPARARTGRPRAARLRSARARVHAHPLGARRP